MTIIFWHLLWSSITFISYAGRVVRWRTYLRPRIAEVHSLRPTPLAGNRLPDGLGTFPEYVGEVYVAIGDKDES